jgi:MFS family permease
LFVSYVLSSMGSAAGAVAVAFLAYRESESVVLTVLVLAGNTVPFLFFAPLSGRLLTRRDARVPLVCSQIAKVVLLLVAGVLASTGSLDLVLLLVGTFLYGSLAALAAPVWPRLFEVLEPEHLTEITALFSSAYSIAMIGGALGGGLLLTTIGESWVFALDAATYLPLVVVVLTSPPLDPLPRTRSGVLREGARAVLRTAALRRAFVLAAVLNLAAFPLLATLPAIAHDVEPGGHVLGYLTAAFYVGAALVAIAVVWLRRRYRASQILVTGYLVSGVLLLLHVVLTNWRDPGYDAVGTAVITLLPIGLAVTTTAVLLQALVQLESDAQTRAGVIILYATLASLVTPLGGVAIGAVIDTWSLWWGLTVSGVVLIVVALALRGRLDVLDVAEGPAALAAVRGVGDHHWSLHARPALGGDFTPHAWAMHRHLRHRSRPDS